MEIEENENTEEIVNTDVLKCELNTLSRADGSSILCQNNTVMAAAVYGPVEVKQHKMLIDKAYIEIVFRPKCGLSQIGDRLLESIIGKICENAILSTFYPRTAIYIIVQEMQNSGAALACSINAACLALIHAGIGMNFLFAAVTSKIYFKQSNFIILNNNIYLEFKEFTRKQIKEYEKTFNNNYYFDLFKKNRYCLFIGTQFNINNFNELVKIQVLNSNYESCFIIFSRYNIHKKKRVPNVNINYNLFN
ncbi:hypothetical protein PGB90_007809 [Kerria lacca]